MDLTFKLTVEMTNAILESLGNAPYRIAAPIVAELQQQAAPQMQPQLVKQDNGPIAEVQGEADGRA